MSKTWSLFKVLLPQMFSQADALGGGFSMGGGTGLAGRRSLFGFGKRAGSRSPLSHILAPLLVAFYSAFMSYTSTLNTLKTGNPELVRSYFPLLATALCILPLIAAISLLFHANDTEQLLVLPLTTAELTHAKLLQAGAYALYTMFPMLMPALLAHGYLARLPWFYYLGSVLGLIPALLTPLSLLLIPFLLLIRYTRFGRNKDRFTMLASGLMLVLVLGFVIVNNYLQSSGSSLLSNPRALAENPYSWLIPSLPAYSRLLFAESATDMLLWLAVLYGLSVLVIFVFERLALGLYLPAAQAVGSGVSASASRAVVHKDYRQRSAIFSLARREWLSLWRSPTFMMQCLLSSILIPVILIISIVASLLGAGQKFNLPELQAQIAPYFADFWSIPVYFLFVGCFLLGLFGSSANVAVTSISRQGEQFSLLQQVPQAPQRLFWGLILPSLPGPILFLLPFGLAVTLLLKLPFYMLLLLWLSGSLGFLAVNFISLALDSSFPRLHWQNEIQAVKNTPASLIAAFGSMLVAAGLAYLAFVLSSKLEPRLLIPAFFAFALLLSVAFYVLATWSFRRCLRREI